MNRRDFLKMTGGVLATWALSSMVKADELLHDRRPNILLLFPDQHRFDWLGNQPGMPIQTPNLTALAARGVQFSHAICPSPLCAPSRAALALGKEYDRCRVQSNGVNMPLDDTTFYTLLRNSGYHVMGCGKFDLHKGSMNWGLDGKHQLNEWGFSDGIDNAGKRNAISSGAKEAKDPYMAYLEQRGLRLIHVEDFRKRKANETFPTPLPDDAYCDNWIGRNGMQLLAQVPAGKPWFMQVNFSGPHEPWDITRSMEERARKLQGFPPHTGTGGLTPEQHLAVRQNYSAMVENIDRWVGLFLETLRKRGELDNTLIVYSSDHGEMLGDHEQWGKQQPYHPSVSVPLIVAGPQVRKGVVNTAPTATLDLAGTFLDVANVARPADMDTQSLMPVLTGVKERTREVVFSGLGKWRLVYDGRYKLIRENIPFGKIPPLSPDEKTILYDLQQDPGEHRNIAAEAPEQVTRLMKCFDALRKPEATAAV